MNRRPNLIAPVLVVACALIVMGGIATGLSETGDSAATAALPFALHEDGTAAPTDATGTAGAGTATTVTATETAGPVSTTVPPAAGADWPLANGDGANTRSRAVDGTSGAGVTGLKEEWSSAIATGSSANPIVVGDRVFAQDASGTTYAFDLATGAERWRRSDLAGGNRTTGPAVPPTAATQAYRPLPVLGQEGNGTVGPTTIAATANATVSPAETPVGAVAFAGPHGPVAGDGRIYVPVAPASLAALDQATGDLLWSRQLTGDTRMVIAMQPSFANGLVYVSTSPGPRLDEPEGGGIGTIYAVDAASGQVRWEFLTVDSADVWGNAAVNSGGGARYGPAFDGGTMYWSTAGTNPAPGTRDFPNAGSRPGPSLWTNGVGAIDAASGAPGWFTQAIPADIYGQGFFVPPVLANATVQNQARALAIGAGEDGRVVAFDRATGAIVWTASVGRHENDRLERFPDAGITAWPGALGGVSTPMAVANGYVYVASVELPTSYFPGGIASSLDLAGARGLVSALNLSTGRTAWQKLLDSAPTGGATVASGLVLTGTYDGRVLALDTASGEVRAARSLVGPITSTPAVSGDLVIWQAGSGAGARVVVLAVEGGAATATPAATATGTTTMTAGPTSAAAGTIAATFAPVVRA